MNITYKVSKPISNITDITDNENQEMTFCLTEHLFAYQTNDKTIKLIPNSHFDKVDINENSVEFNIGIIYKH